MNNSFKYIKNIIDGEATILLYSQIGSSVDENGVFEWGISGSEFAAEMKYLQDKCNKINVRINSVGGSVLEGYSIISSILNSKVECCTYIDGIAASIAAVIAISGSKCYMMDYGTLMVHNPSGGDDEAVTSIVKDTLTTIMSNRCGKSKEDVSEMMNKETWITPYEALEMKMIDEIVYSGKQVEVKEMSAKKMALVYNKLINKKTIKMEKVIDFLKLKNEATEEEIVNVISEKDAEINSLKEQLESYKQKEQLEIESKQNELKEAAISIVNEAKEEGKITENEVEKYTSLAVSDIEMVKNIFSKITVEKKATPVFDFNNSGNTVIVNDRSNWTFTDWSKKDSDGLLRMKNETPELFNELVSKIDTTLKSKI